MSREGEILSKALDFARERSNMVNAHLIRARAASQSREQRARHLDAAIMAARAIVDDLATRRVALGARHGDAA
jgi:hypothetical protein